MGYLEAIADFFGAEEYSQHSLCLTNDPIMVWFYVVAGLTIGASYLTISTALIRARQRGVQPRPIAFTLFAAFIMLCGLTHLTAVLTLFFGVYRLDVLIHVATASVSGFTALYTVLGATDARTA